MQLGGDEDTDPIVGYSSGTDADNAIVSFVSSHTDQWEDYRSTTYDDNWLDYYNIYNGKWNSSLKTRDSERSKLISPATQQACDNLIAGLEEALFGKGDWFDFKEDVRDQNGEPNASPLKRLLKEDMEKDVKPAIVDSLFPGTVYGTGIVSMFFANEQGLEVKCTAVDPKGFVVDPAGTNPYDGLGCAIIREVPPHTVYQRMQAGIYRDVEVGTKPDGQESDIKPISKESLQDTVNNSEVIKLTEYFGLLPESFLDEEAGDYSWDYDDKMVECIAIVANDSTLLKIFPNPLTFRPVFRYQHDRINNLFWGRGAVEKAWNSQKALDGELRARMDNMALTVHPMIGVDGSRMPRGANLAVKPGKVWITNGDPNESLKPFRLGDVPQSTFPAAGDFERMVQMSTGAVDTASPISQNPRNATASGMSMMQSTVIMRSKRTLRNISMQLVEPLVNAYFQIKFKFDEAYQQVSNGDEEFIVTGTEGIMAREYEQSANIQMMSVLGPDHPATSALVKGILENSSLNNKDEIIASIEQATKPDPEQEQMQKVMQQAQLQTTALTIKKLEAEIEKIKSEIVENLAEAGKDKADAEAAIMNAEANQGRTLVQARQTEKEREPT